MSAENEVVLSEATNELAAKLVEAGLKVTKDGGLDTPDGMIEKVLEGSGLEMATVKKVDKFRNNLLAAVGKVVVDQGVDVMKKHKSVEAINGEISLNKDVISVNFKREDQVRVPGRDGAESTIKPVHGNLTMGYKVQGASTSKGELKKVREYGRQLAAKAFGG